MTQQQIKLKNIIYLLQTLQPEYAIILFNFKYKFFIGDIPKNFDKYTETFPKIINSLKEINIYKDIWFILPKGIALPTELEDISHFNNKERNEICISRLTTLLNK